jgi:multidrug efflux pump subunit AcrB
MLAIVRIALSRPYTFVVVALLIFLVGTLAALRMPVDIFPRINIPNHRGGLAVPGSAARSALPTNAWIGAYLSAD